MKMKNLNLPLFGNTCGKLYDEYIVLASANRERTLPLNSVKKVTFTKSIAISSLLFMLLPGVLFILPYFLSSEDAFIKVLLYAIGSIIIAFSIFKAEQKYAVKVYTKNGSVLTVKLIKENMHDAKKFVSAAATLIAKNEAALKVAAADERLAGNIFSSVSA